jgi:hypothetical protein
MMKMMPMISCREASRLMSEKMDRGLGLAERLSLGLHLAMCKGCSMISKQIIGLRKLFRAFRRIALKKTLRDRLSPEQKARIKQKLKTP